MLYMPASTFATPIVLQETKLVAPIAQYVMLQPAAMIPTMPLFSTALVYPTLSFVAKSVEKDATNKTQKQEVTPAVQHVIHHHTCGMKTCPGYCELCCPWIEHSSEHRARSRSPSPPAQEQQQQQQHHQQRHSRRDEFDQSRYDTTTESIDDKIERIRRELHTSSVSKRDQSTETIDYYRPPPSPPVQDRVPYKQHYDAPKPRSSSRSRSRSRPRSASSLTREPWRPSNRNNYPWRDAHLPAYRAATLSRSQTPVDEVSGLTETAHHRSHSQTRNANTYYNTKDYIYRPTSEAETRKWYVQSTGKDPDHEVHQALHGGTTPYTYTTPSSTSYGKNSYYSEVPSRVHSLHQVDSTQYHNLYGCNEACLHIVPKQGGSLDPPYLKILNAPITYLH